MDHTDRDPHASYLWLAISAAVAFVVVAFTLVAH